METIKTHRDLSAILNRRHKSINQHHVPSPTWIWYSTASIKSTNQHHIPSPTRELPAQQILSNKNNQPRLLLLHLRRVWAQQSPVSSSSTQLCFSSRPLARWVIILLRYYQMECEVVSRMDATCMSSSDDSRLFSFVDCSPFFFLVGLLPRFLVNRISKKCDWVYSFLNFWWIQLPGRQHGSRLKQEKMRSIFSFLS